MAYLKAKYPLEFYASILQSSASTSDVKFNEIVTEMKSLGLSITLPDINISEESFIVKNGKLVYPLSEIRGVPNLLVTAIIEERNNGPFSDFFNFISRLYPYKISEKNIISLINAGVFDNLNKSRASLRASVNRGLQFAELNFSENGQMNLSSDFVRAPALIEKEDEPMENLNLEYEAIGIMLSDSPLTYKKDILEKNNVTPIAESKEKEGLITLGGFIKAIKVINTKKGTPMAFMKIFDDTGEMEIIIFSNLFSEVQNILEINNLILIKGNYKFNKGETTFIASSIELIGE